MAFGKHWEWRGFGEIPEALRSRLESLPLKFSASQELTDEYLWAPGCSVNLKLRFSDLKFKRLCERAGSLELWLEDPGENYPFPIGPEVLTRLASDLGVSALETPRSPLDRPALLDLLTHASPAVRLVTVQKIRWQREWWGSAVRHSPGVTVEVAQILRPELTWSVGIEGPELEGVASALAALDLEGALRKINYLEALEVWSGGRTLGA